MPGTYDLFLSYRWADKSVVEPLVAALRSRGVTVWQDAREVEDMASIQQAVATGLSATRALLAWYSGRYNESRACQWELTSAYTAGQAEGDPRRRIVVVNPESGNAHVHLPELFDQLHLSGPGVPGDAVAVEGLSQRIQTALDRVPTTPMGALQSLTPPLWLPAMGTGSSRFVGRLRDMWQLHGALQAGQAAMLTGTGGKPGLAIVRGAGGIGKSLMAEEYALRFGAAYPGGVFWLRAFGHTEGEKELDVSQRISLRDAQVLEIASRLAIDTSELSPSQVRGALTRHFVHQALPFLWVVDDLPADLGPEGLGGWQAPHPLGCTLFTTRTRRFGHVPTIELPRLDADDAVRLLTRDRLLSPGDRDTAGAICDLLGNHALAVDVTAALVDRRGLNAVQGALQHPGRDALDLAAQLDEALPNGHQRHIAATFLAGIRQLDEPAYELLRYAAVLAEAPIPIPLLVACIVAASHAATHKVDPTHARDQVDLAISQLLSQCLAEDVGADSISVHTLVSRTVRFRNPAPDSWHSVRARVVGVLSSEMTGAADDIRLHANLAPWVLHARAVSASAQGLETAELLSCVARYDFERGGYLLCRPSAVPAIGGAPEASSSSGLRGEFGLVCANGPAPVDAFEQHRQLRRRQRHAARCGLRPDEATTLQSLGQQHQPLAVEPQHLEDVPAAAAEDEDVAAEWVLSERGLHDGSQAVEAFPHVGVAGDDPHASVRRQPDHRRGASASKMQRSASPSTGPNRRTQEP